MHDLLYHMVSKKENTNTNLQMREEDKDKFNYLDERKGSKKIRRIVNMLKGDGAYDDLTNFRTRKEYLRKHIENIYNGKIDTTSSTTRTDLFKSFLVQIMIRLFKRKIKIPTFDIKPTSESVTSYEEKSKASIVKSLLQWFFRVTRYENIVKKSRDDQFGYGNRYIQLFTRKIRKSDATFPGLKNVNNSNVLIDPNCTAIKSENYLEQAQYVAITDMYPEKNLVSRFGEWILDYAIPCQMTDNERYNQTRTLIKQPQYEVIEVQDKSTGEEYCLVGGGAFPVIAHVEGGYDMKETAEIKKMLPSLFLMPRNKLKIMSFLWI